MKKNIIITTLIVVSITLSLNSCSEKKSEQTDSLTELKAKRDSLKTEFKNINAELKSVERKISELDPHKNLYIVSTVKSELKNFKHYIKVQGNVNSDQNITMYPEMGGLINKVSVVEGQKVKKGQELIKYDSEVIKKTKKEIESALQLAETTYKKQKKLWEQNIGSEIQYLQAKTNYESMQSKKAAIDAQLEQMRITAPFSGIIDEIFVKEGEMSAPNVPALRLINLDDTYIEADVSEKYLSKINKGTPAIVDLPNLNSPVKTEVKMTGNFIKPGNRTFRVILDVPNSKRNIKPNQIAVVNLMDLEKTGVIIPSNVILNSPDGTSYVYTVESGKESAPVKKVIIEKGPSYKGETIVYNGLEAGLLVVDKGSRNIQNGQMVKVQ